MTASREQQILEEIKIRLNGSALGLIPKPSGLIVERSRLRELAPSHLPAIGIYPLEADSEEVGSRTQEDLAVKIAIFAKGAGTTPVDQDLDPIDQWVHQQLYTDKSLSGLCLGLCLVKKTWGFNLSQNVMGDLDLHYLVTFRHQSNNPSLG
jgi:hypothetical protein